MSQATSVAVPIDARHALVRSLGALLETTKPRITRMVTITSMVGFVLAALGRAWAIPELILAVLGCVVGTALAAAGANALNQWQERDRDARMPRTAERPLPSNRATPRSVLLLSLALSGLGVALLLLINGIVPATIAAVCVISYVAWYTPLKTKTPWATLVGAIPGALPPLIGWAAGRPEAGWMSIGQAGGLSLFALMFVWQLPHFMAIAWVYREDYALGGYKVLPVIDPSGRTTSLVIMTTTLVLVPMTIAPALALPELLGPVYITIASLSGLAVLYFAYKVCRHRTLENARAVFITSIIHLPLLLIAMVGEAVIRAKF